MFVIITTKLLFIIKRCHSIEQNKMFVKNTISIDLIIINVLKYLRSCKKSTYRLISRIKYSAIGDQRFDLILGGK